MTVKIKHDKKSLLIGILFSAIVYGIYKIFGVGSAVFEPLILLWSFFVCLIRVEVKDKWLRLAVIVLAIGTTATVDFYWAHNCMDQWSMLSYMAVWNRVLNLLGYSIIILAVYLCSGNLKISCLATTLVALVLPTANYYVVLFRGSEMTVSDLLSIGTAVNVVGGYQFRITEAMLRAWLEAFACMVLLFSGIQIPRQRITGWRKITICALGICIAVLAYGSSNIVKTSWKADGSLYNGTLISFFAQQKTYKKPEDYDQIDIAAEEEKYARPVAPDGSLPDMIVIMSEAFADLGVYQGELKTTEPYMPFYDSLEENTVKGYALSSIFGGTTANSEYEFLCGNSMGFLPEKSVGFQERVKSDTYSWVKYLKTLGYETIGMHPYLKNGWQRYTVWPKLGLSDTYFLEDFPQEKLRRGYVSDQEMFEQIIQLVNNRESDVPVFLYGVTMQNHGGYDATEELYQKRIALQDYSQEYPSVNEYLSLMYESDVALRYLLEQLQDSDRPTVVVFYGDHQPALEDAFYEELNGGPFGDLQEQMKKYIVPFFVWANYDIPEETVTLSSLNFLSNYMLEAAGIELPSYNQFLKDVAKEIPAMNANGYYSLSQEKFLPYEEAEGKEQEILSIYRALQYNSIKGGSKRSKVFFE